MIGYIEGYLKKKYNDRVLVVARGIGYEILVPAGVMTTLETKNKEQEVGLYIYYQQTERQPKPLLIGFIKEDEKEFFEYFISVEDIGPLKAVRAMSLPVNVIATAIENRDVKALKQLKGIGPRTAQKIIATLEGKVQKFIKTCKAEINANPIVTNQVLDVLVDQLGYKNAAANTMIAEILKHKTGELSAEELLQAVLDR